MFSSSFPSFLLLFTSFFENFLRFLLVSFWHFFRNAFALFLVSSKSLIALILILGREFLGILNFIKNIFKFLFSFTFIRELIIFVFIVYSFHVHIIHSLHVFHIFPILIAKLPLLSLEPIILEFPIPILKVAFPFLPLELILFPISKRSDTEIIIIVLRIEPIHFPFDDTKWKHRYPSANYSISWDCPLGLLWISPLFYKYFLMNSSSSLNWSRSFSSRDSYLDERILGRFLFTFSRQAYDFFSLFKDIFSMKDVKLNSSNGLLPILKNMYLRSLWEFLIL